MFVDLCVFISRGAWLLCISLGLVDLYCYVVFFFQAEDGIRDLVRSRGLGDVYKRQRVRSGRQPPRSSGGSRSRHRWRGRRRAGRCAPPWLSLIHI